MAVTLVATALCADRALATPQAIRPEVSTPAARTFVRRLTVSLRRVLPGIRLVEARRENELSAPAVAPTVDSRAAVFVQLSPFQFRLPPPVRL